MSFDTFTEKIYGTEPDFGLGRQAFHQSCVLSAFALLSGIFLALRVENWTLATIFFVCIALLAFGYWLSRRKDQFKVALAIFTLVAYTTIVSNFFLTQGIDGTTAIISLLALSLFYASSNSNMHWVWTLLSGLVFSGLIFYEYYYGSSFILAYPSTLTRFIDNVLAFIVVIIFIHLTFRLIRKSHEKQSRKLEKQHRDLTLAKENLEQTNHNLTKILSVIGHDVKNPLASIEGFLELINSDIGLSEEEKNTVLSDLHRTVKNTSSMLDDLVRWSKIQMGGQVTVMQNLPLSAWLDHTLSSLEQLAATQGVALSSSYDSEKELYCDGTLMTIIIRNIIQNAIKFTPPGGKIKFEVAGDSEYILFKITDTGVGMDEDEVAMLFTNQSKSRLGMRSEKGVGLGLMLVKEYTHAHKGLIEIQSKVDYGTQFIIKIPVSTSTSQVEVAVHS
jgi:signal transduction histidine kinase